MSPRIAKWFLLRIVQSHDIDFAVGDFMESYASVRRTQGRCRAAMWLLHEFMRSLPRFVKTNIAWRMSMFRNYIKIAGRNLLKQSGYSIINILGLAIGMAVALLILLWVRDELSYDRHYEHADTLYRAVDYEVLPSGEKRYSPPTPPILAEHVKQEFPEIVRSASMFTPLFNIGGDERRFTEIVGMVSTDFLEMFSFHFIQGAVETAFRDIHSIVLTESLARKLFEDADAMGNSVKLDGSTGMVDLTVRGIIEDLNPKTHFTNFTAFLPIKLLDSWGRSMSNWGDHSFKTYVQVEPQTDITALEQKIAESYRANIPGSKAEFYLQPVAEIHFNDLRGRNLMIYVHIVSVMALFILLVACINYMNLSTARAVKRAREVGLRRLVGAERAQLIWQFLGESILMAFFAMFAALLLTHLSLPGFSRLAGKTLGLDYSPGNIGLIAGIAVCTGMISGMYPAMFLSRFRMTDVLRGSKMGGRGTTLRRMLVVVQFSLSILLIIGTGLIYKQIRYMRNRPLGYSSEHIVCMDMSRLIYRNFTSIRSKMMENPRILDMTMLNVPLDERESSTTFEQLSWAQKTEAHNSMIISIMGTDEAFLSTFDVEMAQGRFYQADRPTDRMGAVLNEKAVEVMGIEHPLETEIRRGEYRIPIIGVIRDFHYRSLHYHIEPLLILYRWGVDNLAIRLKGEAIPESLEHIEKTIQTFIPGYTLAYEFLDDRIDQEYRAENRTEAVARALALLAVFISCIGLLGLASFSAEQRTKEIGIRKVLGSSAGSIVLLLLRSFTGWVLLANVFAWPFAYFIGKAWLQNFAYRTPLGIGLFLLGGITAIVLSIMTVSFQSIRAASADPVDTLRYE